MERTLDNVERARHPRCLELPRVFTILIVEEIIRSYANPRGRQTAEVVPSRGRLVVRNAQTAGFRGEIRPPAKTVILGQPHPHMFGVMLSQYAAVIEHGIHQDLEDRGN
jgi:hypothetical protein